MEPTTAPAAVVADRLAALPLLQDLPPSCRAALAASGKLATFPRDATILREGERAESLFIVLRGRVKMSRATPIGRNVILALFGPGEVFGAVAALVSRTADATMTALEETQCLEIERAALFQLFGREPGLLEQILPVLARLLVEC